MIEIAFKALNKEQGEQGNLGEVRARFKKMPGAVKLHTLASHLLAFPDVDLVIAWDVKTGHPLLRLEEEA